MPRILRETLIDYIKDVFEFENEIKPQRIYEYNDKKYSGGDVFYLIERELRLNNNPALLYAIKKSKELNVKLKIICPKLKYDVKNKQEFIQRQILQCEKNFLNSGFDFSFVDSTNLIKYLKDNNAGFLIIDFNPIENKNRFYNFPFKIIEIDGHNIIPARFLSDKQEYSAATIRRKIYLNIAPFLTWDKDLTKAKVEADFVLEDFIENKLDYYREFRNDPTKDVQSNLSKYLNLGFISSKKAALEVIKSNAKRENKEAFLEELIIRKELSDNFCLYCKDFKSLTCAPQWAKISLKEHKSDLREYIYSKNELEHSKTHDELWNATQRQLTREGRIHGYLRMYWAKQILRWSNDPNCALKNAIYLNDKYAYDAKSANGYVSILWAIAGLHDRAFKDRYITGKIRIMTKKSIAKKFDIKKYIEKYST